MLAFDGWRGFGLDPCPNTIRRAFFDAYKHDQARARRLSTPELHLDDV